MLEASVANGKSDHWVGWYHLGRDALACRRHSRCNRRLGNEPEAAEDRMHGPCATWP